jgi:ribosomal protein S18 acetylase RimI-like enzyme
LSRSASPVIRPARKTDASEMVALIDSAGYGIPLWVWSGMRIDEASVLEVGRQRAMREEGAFSHRNAHMLEVDGHVAGMMLGYRIDDPYVIGDQSGVPEQFRALIELEAEVPGSYYVNVLSVHQEHRGQGHGATLLTHADAIARNAGAILMSIIVESRNAVASRLYERAGYREKSRRGRIAYPGDYTGSEEWVLLTKQLKS